MAKSYGILGQLKTDGTVPLDLYQVPTGKQSVVSSIHVCSFDAADTTFGIAIIKSGETLANKCYLFKNKPLTAGNYFNFNMGISLGTGDKIVVITTSTSVSFNVFGVEIS